MKDLNTHFPKAHVKLLNFINYQEITNENHNVIPLHIYQNGSKDNTKCW